MGFCFVCNAKLQGEQTRICSNLSPHNNIPLAEQIADFLGEEFVVIVTVDDYMCQKCTDLLNCMDKLEYDLKEIQNVFMTQIQQKYGFLNLPVVNGSLKTGEQLEVAGPENPTTISTAKENVNMQEEKSCKKQSLDNISKEKMYKCVFCNYQTKELALARMHVKTHSFMKKNEKLQTPAAPAKTADLPPTKILYKCQICSETFECKERCLNHIQNNHKSSKVLANEKKKSESSVDTSNTNLKPVKSKDNQQEEPINVDNNTRQQDKDTKDTSCTLLNRIKEEPVDFPDSQETEEPRNSKKSIYQESGESELEPVQKTDDNENKDEDLDTMLAGIDSVKPPVDFEF